MENVGPDGSFVAIMMLPSWLIEGDPEIKAWLGSEDDEAKYIQFLDENAPLCCRMGEDRFAQLAELARLKGKEAVERFASSVRHKDPETAKKMKDQIDKARAQW
jgi:hypothetical protein